MGNMDSLYARNTTKDWGGWRYSFGEANSHHVEFIHKSGLVWLFNTK